MNKNRINTMFLHYADVKKSVIIMPHTESFEVELCKTGYDIYICKHKQRAVVKRYT